jgi:uncharacterized protein
VKLNGKPTFLVIANNKNVTDKIRERFKSLRLVDSTGTTADTVEIALADHDKADPIALPPTGAELEIFLGYDDASQRMGLFVVDEIEVSGFPGEMIIRARAAPYTESKGGMRDLQTQKTRSWPKGTTIGAMVKRIAGEHRLKPAVSAALAGIALPHTDQAHESDMNLLLRLAKRYDAVAKPAGGALVFTARGAASRVSGRDMSHVTLTPLDGNDYRVTIASRDSSGACIAYYRDTRKAQRHEVKIGDGDPVIRLRMSYADRVSAENAARAEQRKRARAERTLFYSLPGRPDLAAEALVTMQGFRPGVDGDWLVTRAEHYVGSNGYRCTIECEKPNTTKDATAATRAEAVDQVQDATTVE